MLFTNIWNEKYADMYFLEVGNLKIQNIDLCLFCIFSIQYFVSTLFSKELQRS